MSMKDYFSVELASGRKPNVLDYICASVMGVIMVVFFMIPYMILIAATVAVLSVWAFLVRLYFKARGKEIPPTFS